MKRTLKTTVASLSMFAFFALAAAPVASDFDALGRNRPVIEVEGFKRPVIEAGGFSRPTIEVEGVKRPITTSAAPWTANGRLRP